MLTKIKTNWYKNLNNDSLFSLRPFLKFEMTLIATKKMRIKASSPMPSNNDIFVIKHNECYCLGHRWSPMYVAQNLTITHNCSYWLTDNKQCNTNELIMMDASTTVNLKVLCNLYIHNYNYGLITKQPDALH